MEEVEAGLLEGGIGWLAETILENLDTDKLGEWIRQIRLADDTEKLISEIKRVEVVVAAVKGRAIANRALARSLGHLRELLYDADDAVDELDYNRLQLQVQGVTWHEQEDTAGHGGGHEDDGPLNNTDVPAGCSSSTKRSKAWVHFTPVEYIGGKASKARCKYCDKDLRCISKNGTSALRNHIKICKRGASDKMPNLSTAGDGASDSNYVATGALACRKRRRTNEESIQHVAAKPWKKADFSNRIQQITRHLQEAMNEILRLNGSNSSANSNLYHSTSSDSHLITSSLLQRKTYGRVTEKNYVIKLVTEDDSDGVTVVPIVGIGGIGKTALAQHIYNNPIVECQFQQRIWVCVSNNFDEVRLTREMLDFACQEKQGGSCGFAKLQESLMSNIKSKRFLLVLDDVWDDSNIFRWNKLLAPLKSNNTKGNMVLVTTRSMSVAKRIGTIEAIKLGALEKKDFWQLFIECAFGDEKYEAHGCLSTVAQQIADKLEGNPLAAETTGELLRKHHTVDHWTNILKNEDWKSLKLSGGIMSSLKLSYDQLPSHLQQCFLYCSIFPNSYRFVGEELVRIWTSQGFVKCSHSNKRLEEIGQEYLTDLVNLGFFELAERKEPIVGGQVCYAVCGIMHDFARIVSRTEYATIDGLQCKKLAPTIRHLSILPDSVYHVDPEKFDKIIRNSVPSVRNLRTLVLIGEYAFFFIESFKDIVQQAQNIRLLQMSSARIGVDYLLRDMVNPPHIRYIKLDDGASPQSLSKFYHLQVLDVGSKSASIIPGMDNLVNLRHLIAADLDCSPFVSIGKMTSLQKLHDFSVSSLGIAQLESMNELVQLGVHQLENVVNRDKASGARLGDKLHLEKVHFSWSADLPQDVCDSSREVLEGLKPHQNLKHLQISWYNGTTPPSWLATSLTYLQTLHLEYGNWQILPSLDSILFLWKLELTNLQKVVEVPIHPSLEELTLTELPKLERCSCSSIRGLNSSLRVLKIERCPVLKVFPLFENCHKLKIEPTSWSSRLSKLTIHDCPHLHVHNPLPPSPLLSELSISRVPEILTMEGSSNRTLRIGSFSDMVTMLDDKVLSFHNLRFLTRLVIEGCQNVMSLSFRGFRQLIHLKWLEMHGCQNLVYPTLENNLVYSPVRLEPTWEDMTAANSNALPSLERLHIEDCGITGRWLSLMLQHVQALHELSLNGCEKMTGLSIRREENCHSNIMSAPEASSLGFSSDVMTSSDRDGLLCIPLNLISSLKKVSVAWCFGLTFYRSGEGFAGFTSLEELNVVGCPKLFSPLVHNATYDEQANRRCLLPISLLELVIKCDDSLETLQPFFPGNFTRLKKLVVRSNQSLTSLQLHPCTALQELRIEGCESLSSLDGLQWLGNLRLLRAYRCLNNHGGDKRCLLPQSLEELYIDDYSQETLQPCFLRNLTCLKKLKVSETARLKFLELQSCTALEELTILDCRSLTALEGLQSLRNLMHLSVHKCSRLPPYLKSLSGRVHELCPRLARLQIDEPSVLTTSFCKHLTSLQHLQLDNCRRELVRQTDDQDIALQLFISLQELVFWSCYNLRDLPARLHSLSSLKRLEITYCKGITRLPEKSLPPSLEELDINDCKEELNDQCRMLASKLKVKINRKYVN